MECGAKEPTVTWFADLSPCSYFATRDWPDGCADVLRSVGWLSADHAYTQRQIEPTERERLAQLLENHWDFCFFCGLHTCELCLAHDSNGSLFVPSKHVIFVAPVAIGHYIDVHGYLPPREFLDAVLGCPAMGSDTYLSALVNGGGKAFALMTGLLEEPAPCPYCGKPLITPRARLCHYCKMDWHDPEHPRRLGAA